MTSAGIRTTVAKKLLFVTASTVLVLASLFLPFEAYLSYRRAVAMSSEQVEQIYASHIPALVSSLWLTDYDLLDEQISAIERFPYIRRITVLDDEGRRYSSGREEVEGTREIREKLTYSRRGSTVEVGTLFLYIDEKKIIRDAWTTVTPFLAYHIAALFIITLAVSLVSRMTVGRHLKSLAEYIRHENLKDYSAAAKLNRKTKRPDEIDYLAEAIDTLQTRIRRELEDKDLLIKEVHHRIKNNMAAVESLLLLQASRSDDTSVASSLRDAAGRVHSISRLYGKLYKSGDADCGTARDYLGPLAEEILSVSGVEDIEINTDIEELKIDVETLKTLGIILNELITNSLKHAFSGNGGGISIRLFRSGKSKMRLEYRDTGAGLPPGFDPSADAGLGMMIINSLTEQIRGDLLIGNGGGFEAAIDFPAREDW